MCIYLVMKPLFLSKTTVSSSNKVVTAAAPLSEDKMTRRVYTVDFIRSINSGVIADSQFTYSISPRPVEYRYSHSPTPYRSYKSPDPSNYFHNHTPEPNGFISRPPRGRLDSDEKMNFTKDVIEMTPDVCPLSIDELPKDIQTGSVHYLVKKTGRIRPVRPLNDYKYVFFHIKDCELEEGETLNLGDSVMYELSIHDNKLCAIHVKKIPKISSPEFSRRVMKHSKENAPELTDFIL